MQPPKLGAGGPMPSIAQPGSSLNIKNQFI